MLHDPASQMIDLLFRALKDGQLCVVDVSQMRGSPALALSGLLLRRIFDHNQEEFTRAVPATIPTIAVVEEAQSVLSNVGTSGERAYVEWVKEEEGRKYDLGAVLVTQQPGSIPQEVLSQVDQWFVFHLLSSGDSLPATSAPRLRASRSPWGTPTEPEPDRLRETKNAAIQALAESDEMRERLEADGPPLKAVQVFLAEHLPETLSDRDSVAYHLVREAMDRLYAKGVAGAPNGGRARARPAT
jgi:hypothetical protein